MWGIFLAILLIHSYSFAGETSCSNLFLTNTQTEYAKANILKSIPRYKNLTNLFNHLSDAANEKLSKGIEHTPEENLKIVKMLNDKVKQRLKEKGIAYRVVNTEENPSESATHYSKIIGKKELEIVVIKPSKKTQLGRLAKFLDKKLPGFMLAYNALIDYELYMGGYVDTEKNHMGLPIYMFEKLNPKEEAILYHELRHFIHDVALFFESNEQIPFIEIASINNKKLDIEEPYHEIINFDEVFAYFESIRFGNIFLQSALRNKDTHLASTILKNLIIDSKTHFQVTRFFNKEIHFLFKNLKPIHFKNARIKTIHGRDLYIIEFSEYNIKVELPTLSENEPTTVYEYYIRILEQALSINQHYYSISKVTYNELKDMDLRSKKKLYNKLKALMHTYRKWNFKYSDNVPFTRDEVEEIFEKEYERIKNSSKDQ